MMRKKLKEMYKSKEALETGIAHRKARITEKAKKEVHAFVKAVQRFPKDLEPPTTIRKLAEEGHPILKKIKKALKHHNYLDANKLTKELHVITQKILLQTLDHLQIPESLHDQVSDVSYLQTVDSSLNEKNISSIKRVEKEAEENTKEIMLKEVRRIMTAGKFPEVVTLLNDDIKDTAEEEEILPVDEKNENHHKSASTIPQLKQSVSRSKFTLFSSGFRHEFCHKFKDSLKALGSYLHRNLTK